MVDSEKGHGAPWPFPNICANAEVFVLKMQYNRWINYTVAHENIRRVLSRIPAEVVADFLFVTEQTVKAWQCGKSFPDCSHLIALSMIAGRGLSDFLGVNIPKASPKSIPQLLEAELADSQGIPSENEGWIYESKQELLQKLAYDFSRKENSHIETLGEFILYLPLFDDGNLRDFLYRTTGEITPSYLFEKTQDLYQSLPESPEKRYANQLRYFYMMPPAICDIPVDTTLPHEKAKLCEFHTYTGSDRYFKDEAAYLDKLREFRRRLYPL